MINASHEFRARFRMPHALRLAALVAALCAATASALAADPTYLKVSSGSAGVTQPVLLDVNKSMIVDLPTNVGEVIASAPAIATVVMRSKTRAIVQGLAGGDTNIFFLDPAGNNISTLDVKVVQPRSDVGNALEQAIGRNIPGSRVHVESVLLDGSTNRVVLSGTTLSQDDADKAVAIAVQFAGDPKNVASIISVSGDQQVILKVTVAEVDRTVIKQLGINLDVTGGGLITGLVNSPSDQLGSVSGAAGAGEITASANIGGVQINATLDALARRNALRTLAEPVLTARSGQPASFLVGGEFPYTTSDGNGHVVTAFKQYGVSLNFTPTVKSDG
ncbi:MAG TPA: pilus assembly protein N-terminal domain-containing protein, partial [Devosia sp.]|nr:pilus assembly protein N-terminal domain-containing protein [Devosia sp.]